MYLYRFIEKLVADKEARLKQIAELNKKNKDIEAKYNKMIEEIKEKNFKDLKKNKDAWMASEKLRRENWIKEKTREIKEITAKGLEPEITRIMMVRSIQDHKNVVDRLKEEYAKELKEARNQVEEEVARRLVTYNQRAQREQLLQDKEGALELERNHLNRRMQELIDKQAQEFKEIRREWTQSIHDERDNNEIKVKQEEDRYREKAKELENIWEHKFAAEKEKLENEKFKLRQVMDKEINEVKDRLEREKQDWVKYEKSKLQKELELDRHSMQNQVTAQRDKEINKIIQKLSEEHIQFQKSSERSAEEKVRQARDHCNRKIEAIEKENSELKTQMNSLSSIKGSLNDNLQIIMRRLSDSAVEIDDLKSIKARQEAELNIFRAELQQANKRYDRNIEEAIQQERDKQTLLQHEIQAREDEIEKIKLNYENRLEEATHKEAEAFEALEQRVRSTISKKDLKIKELTDQLNSAIVKIKKLEENLELQRRELTKI